MTLGRGIVFVTGKGGTGKSWIASGLARVAAARGLRAARVQVAPPAEASHDKVRHRDGFDDLVVDERKALSGFLREVVPLGFVARRLMDSRTFSAVAAAAPGLRDLVALAAVADLAKGRDRYDFLAVDAPASGHSVPLVTSPARVAELVSFGPVARVVTQLDRLVHDPARFTVLVVTAAEELSIIESRSLVAELAEAGAPPARVVVNGMWPRRLDEVGARWLTRTRASTDALLHLERRRRQEVLVARLQDAVGPTLSVPQDFGEPAARCGPDPVADLFDALVHGVDAL